MICQLSAQTGIAPALLYAEEPDTVLTLADEVRQRDERRAWSTGDELLASVYEMLQVIRVESLVSRGVKPRDTPEIVRIRRPGEDPPDKRNTVSPRQFAALALGRG